MPFTLSHAAAVLPAVRGDGTGRGRLVPSVLVAGSFAPDTTYYAAGVVSGGMRFGTVTHSLPGVFSLDVLIAWALVGLWLLVREPLVALLPGSVRGRVAALTRCGAPRARVRAASVWWWYVSAALGALTHVVWDAFTHPGRWGVRLLPVLGRQVAGVPVYWLAQYGSSLVAALVVVAFLAHALRRAPAEGQGGRPLGGPAVPRLSARDRWWAAAALAGSAVVGAVQRVSQDWAFLRGTGTGFWDLVPAVCFGAGAGLVLGLPLYAAAVRVLRPTARTAAGSAGDTAGAGYTAGTGGTAGAGETAGAEGTAGTGGTGDTAGTGETAGTEGTAATEDAVATGPGRLGGQSGE
ncbi:DUF4184 family protein [Streptomyces naganishii]|uniref:DUF4184 family protein n=1 Tax=Streptomyces naganishii JCM 4654 TaxID=1306179 RepID=A0A919CSY5_9ACTN|nr:hypothetical protein GCM10010508_03440 [Streptomyces naganishii JCM 4654]